MLHLLDAMAERLAGDPSALALLALGSAGRQQDRLDEHSDLDFFVIANDKHRFLDDLMWLGAVQWSHRDTPDGCKALVADVFCEFAVFTPDELKRIRFEPGRVVWQREGVALPLQNVPDTPSAHWLIDEILSNLYVGLHRWLRGERLSAMRFIQGEALDNYLRLVGAADPFTPSRRAERLGLPFDRLAGGYGRSVESARLILDALPTGGGHMRETVVTLLRSAEQADAAGPDQ